MVSDLTERADRVARPAGSPDPGARTIIRLLGPIETTVDGENRPVAGLRRKGVLAVLALHHRQIVHSDVIVDRAWPADTVVAPNTVQSHVSYLRRLLRTSASIVARPPGYILDAGDDGVDVDVAERLIDRGMRATEPGQRVRCLAAALQMWRGQPLIELPEVGWVQGQIARLDQLRLTARRALIEARSQLGEHASIIPELRQLIREQPCDEEAHRLLMLALSRSGRPAEALGVFHQLRRTLRDDLGIDPSRPLRELELTILRSDAA
jgi:DNA-binding SARP family transcriptional activator